MKAVGGAFFVRCGDELQTCSVRGKVKRDFEIYVGDYVEAENGVIESVYPRKNRMIRPYIANLDALIIVVAPVPEPDWNLVEKLLLNCHEQNIEPVIAYNKIDLKCDAAEKLRPYEKDVKTVAVSAKTGENIDELRKIIDGRLVSFCGQSAVGKSSLINALGGKKLETGELSRKIQRGKNTTRHVEIYDLPNGRIADTCGFSVMENIDIEPEELIYYYDEFLAVQNQCRFANCTHTGEPDCAVKKGLENGTINKDRYERYVKLYEELLERRKKKYE